MSEHRPQSGAAARYRDAPPRRSAGLRARLAVIAVAIVAVPLIAGALLLGAQLHTALIDTLRQQVAGRLTTIALAIDAAGPGVVTSI
ncbi:MAG: hypothetical protein ACTH31_09135, partial [Pseudoclavibacter sp.]